MKIQKNKLLQIVKEGQINEMAAPYSPQSRTLYDADGNIVGHRMKHGSKDDVNRKGSELPASIVIYTCGDEVNEFIQNHQDLLEHIKKTYMENTGQFRDTHLQNPEIIFTNEKTCPKYLPYRREKQYFDAQGNPIQTDIPHIPTEDNGEHYQLKEAINRVLKGILDRELMKDEELNQHLTDCSVPSFKIRDRKYEDRHDINNTNQRVHYGSDAFILYESANDFLGEVLNRTVGLDSEVEKRTTHLARLRNKIYAHWDKTKKNRKKWEGLTDVYKLEKYGLAEKNYDVNIYSKFDVVGVLRQQSTFSWSFKFDVFYGKKVSVDDMINARNIKVFKSIEQHIEVDIDPYKNYPEIGFETPVNVNDHILSDKFVVNGFMEALEEFKAQIMAISVDDALEMANYFQYEVGDEVAEITESFDKLIKNVLKESGMKKVIRIKESDLIKLISENVVKTLAEEQYDDFITKHKNKSDEGELTQPNDDTNNGGEQPSSENQPSGNEQNGDENALYLTLGKDDQGVFYIMKDANTENPQVLAKTK
jgi:hypothetical protein